MSDSSTTENSAIPDTGENVVSGGKAPLVSGALRHLNAALVISVLAIALVLGNWLSSYRGLSVMEQNLGKRLGEFDTRSRESKIMATQAQEGTREALSKLGLLEQKLVESQNQQVALEAMYQELSRNRDEWVLSDIEQTLMIASQQLQLAGNVKAALLALQNADSRLQRLDKPQFYALRKAINKDIDRLRVVPMTDITGANLRLDSLIAAVDDLPLVMENELRPETSAAKPSRAGGGWKSLGQEIWQDFKQLVRIKNVEKPELPLLAPSQSYFLRENLRLRLLNARLSLLQRNEASFKADMKASEAWLLRYFDTKESAAAAALVTVRQLAGFSVNMELPDISESLNTVRNYKLVRERGGR